MACLDCEKSNLIPVCTAQLILGTVKGVDPDVEINIYVRNVTLMKLYLFDTKADCETQLVTNMDSKAILHMACNDVWNPSHYYEVWVTKKTATHIEDRETIVIGQVETECINLNLSRVTNQDSESENYTSRTLSVS